MAQEEDNLIRIAKAVTSYITRSEPEVYEEIVDECSDTLMDFCSDAASNLWDNISGEKVVAIVKKLTGVEIEIDSDSFEEVYEYTVELLSRKILRDALKNSN